MKEVAHNIAGMDVKVAVASGIDNANYVMSKIKDGTADWHFVEIMCAGGVQTAADNPCSPLRSAIR